jgi:chromosome segregation ATPase
MATAAERLAVQEALHNLLKDEVDDLKDALIDLTKQITSLTNALSSKTSDLTKQNFDVMGRLNKVETTQGNTKAFIAGISFTCACIGGLVGTIIDIIVRATKHAG